MKPVGLPVVPDLRKDLTAGLVVFLVALPLCLGIALASEAPAFSGIIAGVIGGLVVGAISGSPTSVSGPAAGLTAIVAAQIGKLGTFETLLAAVVIAGVIQVAMGLVRAGALSAFFPSSVIKGLLAAIGVILILKQIPHLLGHDADPEGEMAFEQPDHENTFSEIGRLFLGEVHPGALVIGLVSVAVLVFWDRYPKLKQSPVPAPLIVVLLGVALVQLLQRFGGGWIIEESHRVEVPVASEWRDFLSFFMFPDFSTWNKPAIYTSGMVIALVASLETLLNLEAVDKLDPHQRRSPPNRELVAQGVGNILCGAVGGLPVTSVIVRSSVNINAGARSKVSTLIHGTLLALCAVFLPAYLNWIPLSALAAILCVTGFKLASPKLFMEMFREGRYQFLPFLITLVAIVFTDLIIGILIGLVISVAFILNSNIRRPVNKWIDKHVGGDVIHIRLANQVSFLNRAALENELFRAPPGSHVLLDAKDTDYIDPDILSLIRDFQRKTAPAHGIWVSTRGFKPKFQIPDCVQFVESTTREIQACMTPTDVLEVLRQGNRRFLSGTRLKRDLGRQLQDTAAGQHPLAVILSCIDSRSPAELIFDTGLGDIFTIRIAGNVVRSKVLGSMEFACAFAGAKLILVMGHTRCGAVNASIDLTCSGKTAREANGCEHLDLIVHEISKSIDLDRCALAPRMSKTERQDFTDEVARCNVQRAVELIPKQSSKLRRLLEEKKIVIVGAMYDVSTGEVHFLPGTDQDYSGAATREHAAH